MAALCGLFYGSNKMANTDIKWFSFENTNAPQLSNTWGCLVDVLDACLVTGFGTQLVSSIAIKDGVAIATFGSAHNFKQFQVIEISGANEAILNGEFKVLGLTLNTIEFLVDSPDQDVTGIISCKLASLGWSKTFSGTQKAVYQAKDKVTNPFFLRVDNSRDPVYTDSYAKFAKVGVLQSCENMDDISGIQAPFDPLNPTKNWIGTGSGTNAKSGWIKWRYTFTDVITAPGAEVMAQVAGNRSWILIGNKDSFYLVNKLTVNTIFELPYAFGCVLQNGEPKPMLVGAIWDREALYNHEMYTSLSSLNQKYVVGLIDYNGSLVSNNFFRLITGFGVVNSGVDNNTLKFDVENSLIISPIFLVDHNDYVIGELPIVKACISNASAVTNHSLFFYENTTYIACRYRVSTTGKIGVLLFKVYGEDS